MTIHLVPLVQFSDYHKRGWRMVPGYSLNAGDYCATMQSPDHEKTRRNNKSAGGASRVNCRGREKLEGPSESAH